MNILIHHASFQQAEGLSCYIIKYIYIYTCDYVYNIYISMYIHMYIYIHVYTYVYTYLYIYIYVCVPILWQHKFFSKCCRIGVGTPSFAQKRESLEKINIVIDVGNLGRKTLSVTSMVPKKGENYTWKKRRLFIGKNSSICSMTPESP